MNKKQLKQIEKLIYPFIKEVIKIIDDKVFIFSYQVLDVTKDSMKLLYKDEICIVTGKKGFQRLACEHTAVALAKALGFNNT